MRRLNLSLKNKSPRAVVEICRKHKIAVTGNPHFTSLKSTEAEFDHILEATKTALWEVASLKADLAATRTRLRQNVARLKTQLTTRAAFIESQAGGDPAKLATCGLGLRRERTSISELPAPENLIVKPTGRSGQVRVQWTAVDRARVYALEYRSLLDPSATQWTAAALTTKSKALIHGLTPDQRHLFRVRAHGTRDIASPWSAEVSVMVG